MSDLITARSKEKYSDVYCVTITEHPKSLERFERQGQVLYFIGKGRCSTPGYPTGNQVFIRMLPFFKVFSEQGLIPVFRKDIKGVVHYMGLYQYKSHIKKMSFAGFMYIEIKMYRYVNDV